MQKILLPPKKKRMLVIKNPVAQRNPTKGYRNTESKRGCCAMGGIEKVLLDF
jgi:hypothetical protein